MFKSRAYYKWQFTMFSTVFPHMVQYLTMSILVYMYFNILMKKKTFLFDQWFFAISGFVTSQQTFSSHQTGIFLQLLIFKTVFYFSG